MHDHLDPALGQRARRLLADAVGGSRDQHDRCRRHPPTLAAPHGPRRAGPGKAPSGLERGLPRAAPRWYGGQDVDDSTPIFEAASRLSREGKHFALITVIRTAGSTPRKPGAKMLVGADGRLVGTVGGGAIEHALVTEALECLRERRPRTVRRHLTHDLAMCCGGEMEVFIEPLGLRETLVLVGAGHIHLALAPVAQALGHDDVEAQRLG
ncbi:MAG: XdhC family protein, partial [Myxococcales bacterium]